MPYSENNIHSLQSVLVLVWSVLQRCRDELRTSGKQPIWICAVAPTVPRPALHRKERFRRCLCPLLQVAFG